MHVFCGEHHNLPVKERVKRYAPYKAALGNNCLSVEEGDEEISVHIGDQLYVNFSRDKICPVPEKLSKSEKKNTKATSAP
jgi:hypothetical protein